MNFNCQNSFLMIYPFIAKAPSLLFVIKFCISIPMHFSDNVGLRKTCVLYMYVVEYKTNISYKLSFSEKESVSIFNSYFVLNS